MKREIRSLQELLNKELMYGIKIIIITGYDLEEERGRVFIHTNEKENHFDRLVNTLPSLLAEFKPVQKKNTPTVNQSDLLIQTATNAEDLKAILLEGINKVKADPNYIKQATAINNNVTSIINITKMQLDFMKVASKIK